MKIATMNFSTRAIHVGQAPDDVTGAVTVPITLASTFKQDGIGKMRQGYEYSRTGNPSRRSLETTLASLECGTYGLCFASGSAASSAILDLLQPGDHVITTIDIYGGTYRLLTDVYQKYQIDFSFLNTANADKILAEIKPKTRMIWVETPTNPLLNIIDIKALTSRKRDDIIVVVDNTFATPYWQTPLTLGADCVVHSTTKYISGHSDVVGGAIVTNSETIYQKTKFYQNAAGGVPSPFDCYLTQRGLKTLEIRMIKHQENAQKIAAFLMESPHVANVFFPGLPHHPNFSVAQTQMRGYPGMVSFLMKHPVEKINQFFKSLQLFTLAESLGGVESLACYPYTMTHGAIPDAEKKKIGITDRLIRLSVGIESCNDLITDLSHAFDKID